jgi:hypothetical protein
MPIEIVCVPLAHSYMFSPRLQLVRRSIVGHDTSYCSMEQSQIIYLSMAASAHKLSIMGSRKRWR